MIEIGTKAIINGVLYRVKSCIAGNKGNYVITIDYDGGESTDFNMSKRALMDKMDGILSKNELAELIKNWWIDEKLRSNINRGQILRVATNPKYFLNQIKRLYKEGESLEMIIDVLAYSVQDRFWSGVLNTSINRLATPRDDGTTLYLSIKNKMIEEVESNQPKEYIPTATEVIGRRRGKK